MPSTENTTLQRIQREISEVIEREKELRTLHHGNIDIANNVAHNVDNGPPPDTSFEEVVEKVPAKREAKPVLIQSKSLGAYPSNGALHGNNSARRFTPNPAAKGVMHKFIKSRGKLTAASLMASPPSSSQSPKPAAHVWNIPDDFEPPRVMDPSQCVRRGFVPVEEKLRKELEDLHAREVELRSERRKSQPDFSSLVEIEPPPHLGDPGMKKARSMAQLYDPDEFNSFSSSSNLKAARSLAELCDTNEEELDAPGSHLLISRWEEMIQKNQQARS